MTGSIMARLRESGRRDNSRPEFKAAIREWLRREIGDTPQCAYEVYGSGPDHLSTRHLRWMGCPRIDGPAGDALESLAAMEWTGHDWWDVDPYGDPFPALALIARRATARRIAVFLCDGGLLKSAKHRTPLPRMVADAMGWHQRDMRRATWCWAHYPQAVAQIVDTLMRPRYRVVAIRVAPYTTLPNGGTPEVRYSGFVAVRTPTAK